MRLLEKLRWATGSRLCLGATRFALLLGSILAGVAPLRAQEAVTMIVGKIRTMDAKNSVAGAVAFDENGWIVAVGTKDEVAKAVKGATVTRLELGSGQTLLPGFIDPHLHLDLMLLEKSGLAELVGPCLPEPYKAGNSPGCDPKYNNYIKGTFDVLMKKLGNQKQDTFVVGLNLDPSRQPWDATTPSEKFKEEPAKYFKDYLPLMNGKGEKGERPILFIDQSGHFGYANRAAFEALKKTICKEQKACEGWPPKLQPEGAKWNTKREPGCDVDKSQIPIACYTGLLTEFGAYAPFTKATDLDKLTKESDATKKAVKETLNALRDAGLTTITSMAVSMDEVKKTGQIAELKCSATRILSIVLPEVANSNEYPSMNSRTGMPKPIEPSCQTKACPLPNDLGVNGIKVILDGSTQGCSAAMQRPVLYDTASECKDPLGHSNYGDDWEQVRKDLWDFWGSGWRIEIHANGNRAFDMALKVYASLQSKHRDNPNSHTATVVHATVGDKELWEKAGALRKGTYRLDGQIVPAVDLRFTHLIGHVAYWGDVFRRQLGKYEDGKDKADNIDPTVWDRDYGIPFTLHSDATVSVPRPLWFVRQAVTRETWKYPGLQISPNLDKDHQGIYVLEALQAVTIRAAEEKELDRWLGSIEVGKVADFVVLSADPMLYNEDARPISEIRVMKTYLGGKVRPSCN
ncbi:MAG: amidohydrolase family protein [Thermoanaerobaculia bacterium]